MKVVTETLIQECKSRLLQIKRDILNRVYQARSDLQNLEKGGDEADQTMAVLQENEFLSAQARMRAQLMEIELALARIESGIFGICEETDEPIESERLRALPWTRLSIEGAEIREAMRKRIAR